MARKVLTGKDIEKIFVIAQDVISLNTPISNERDDAELSDYLEDPSPTPEEEILLADTRENLIKYLRKFLSVREQNIIMLRYGLEDGTPMTLQEIGEELGITRERVRQIEGKALRKLRVMFARYDVTKEDI